MPKIALIRPPQVMPYDVLSISQGVPQIALAYLSSALKRAGHQVTIIDALGEDLNKFNKIEDTKLLVNGLTANEIINLIPTDVDIIGISCTFSNEWVYSRIVVTTIARAFPQVPIIIGGEHVTADPEYSLRTAEGITACVLGEGEETIVDLVNAITNKRPLNRVAGLAFYDEKGIFVKTEPRARIRAISDIAWPDWENYPLENYLSQGFGFNQVRGRPMPLIASRGCPYQCTFCSNPLMWTTRWVARDPIDVIHEIKFYIQTYQINHIEFYDLTAIVKKSWILEFTQLLIKANLQITWSLPSGTRSEALDLETLTLLKKAGCNKLTYAPESGSEATLKRIKKQINLKNMIDSIQSAHKARIRVKSNIIFGFPGQTLGECFETFSFLAKTAWVGMYDVALFSFVPYPGSELFIQLVESGEIPKNSAEYDRFLSGNILGDVAGMKSWSEHITDLQLKLLLIAGFFWFYLLSFFFRPYRLIGVISRLIKSQPETTLDILIDGVIRNIIKGRKSTVINSIKIYNE